MVLIKVGTVVVLSSSLRIAVSGAPSPGRYVRDHVHQDAFCACPHDRDRHSRVRGAFASWRIGSASVEGAHGQRIDDNFEMGEEGKGRNKEHSMVSTARRTRGATRLDGKRRRATQNCANSHSLANFELGNSAREPRRDDKSKFFYPLRSSRSRSLSPSPRVVERRAICRGEYCLLRGPGPRDEIYCHRDDC